MSLSLPSPRPWVRVLVVALAGVSLYLTGCATPRSAALPNTLTAAEAKAGYQLLFDGTTAGWRNFGKPTFPAQGWVVEDGWLHHVAKAGGGDIITRDQFTDFELEFEWRIGKGANSGVKYLISEARGSAIGHEYQVIDDSLHPDAAHGPKRQTAALYDALPPVKAPVRPAGELNHSRIVVRGADVEHWLNGQRVVKYQLGSPALLEAKAQSKFKAETRWGTKFATPILLQDHGDDVWFRNVKLRPLATGK
jgi:hypothetical protein